MKKNQTKITNEHPRDFGINYRKNFPQNKDYEFNTNPNIIKYFNDNLGSQEILFFLFSIIFASPVFLVGSTYLYNFIMFGKLEITIPTLLFLTPFALPLIFCIYKTGDMIVRFKTIKKGLKYSEKDNNIGMLFGGIGGFCILAILIYVILFSEGSINDTDNHFVPALIFFSLIGLMFVIFIWRVVIKPLFKK